TNWFGLGTPIRSGPASYVQHFLFHFFSSGFACRFGWSLGGWQIRGLGVSPPGRTEGIRYRDAGRKRPEAAGIEDAGLTSPPAAPSWIRSGSGGVTHYSISYKHGCDLGGLEGFTPFFLLRAVPSS